MTLQELALKERTDSEPDKQLGLIIITIIAIIIIIDLYHSLLESLVLLVPVCLSF